MTGFMYVVRHKQCPLKPYEAKVWPRDGKRQTLGLFATAEEAALKRARVLRALASGLKFSSCLDLANVAHKTIVKTNHWHGSLILLAAMLRMGKLPPAPFQTMSAPNPKRVVRHAVVRVFRWGWLVNIREAGRRLGLLLVFAWGAKLITKHVVNSIISSDRPVHFLHRKNWTHSTRNSALDSTTFCIPMLPHSHNTRTTAQSRRFNRRSYGISTRRSHVAYSCPPKPAGLLSLSLAT